MEIQELKSLADKITAGIGRAVIGKEPQTRLILAAMVAGGHVLLEDVPGTGKTVFAKTLAKSFGCTFGRVQFTPDLLPSELTGIHFYNPKTGEFNFRKGSLFANIILADEINRATPRTQSGLLESMEEAQITVDGETHSLGQPYFVIATQNPVETHGTFPLPEAQLDRFLIKLSLGYPETAENIAILQNRATAEAEIICTANDLLAMQACAEQVFVHDEICAYMVEICERSRTHETVSLGISTRGMIGLMKICRAFAAVSGRDYVSPDDVKYLAPYVFAHRLMMRGRAQVGTVLSEIVEEAAVPTEKWKNKS